MRDCIGRRECPKALDPNGTTAKGFSVQYGLETFQTQYADYKADVALGTEESPEKARRLRDEIINRIRLDI